MPNDSNNITDQLTSETPVTPETPEVPATPVTPELPINSGLRDQSTDVTTPATDESGRQRNEDSECIVICCGGICCAAVFFGTAAGIKAYATSASLYAVGSCIVGSCTLGAITDCAPLRLVGGIVGGVAQLTGDLIGGTVQVTGHLVGGAAQVTGHLVEGAITVASYVPEAVQAIGNIAGQIPSAVSNIGNSISNSAIETMGQAPSAVSNISNSAIETMGQVPSFFRNIGNSAAGIIEQIPSAFSNFSNNIAPETLNNLPLTPNENNILPPAPSENNRPVLSMKELGEFLRAAKIHPTDQNSAPDKENNRPVLSMKELGEFLRATKIHPTDQTIPDDQGADPKDKDTASEILNNTQELEQDFANFSNQDKAKISVFNVGSMSEVLTALQNKLEKKGANNNTTIYAVSEIPAMQQPTPQIINRGEESSDTELPGSITKINNTSSATKLSPTNSDRTKS